MGSSDGYSQKIKKGDEIKLFSDGIIRYAFIENIEKMPTLDDKTNTNLIANNDHTLNIVSQTEQWLYLYDVSNLSATINNVYDIINGKYSDFIEVSKGDLFNVTKSDKAISSVKIPYEKTFNKNSLRNIIVVNHDDLAVNDYENTRKIYNKYNFHANFNFILKPFKNSNEMEQMTTNVKRLLKDGNTLGLHAIMGASYWWMNKLFDIRPNFEMTFAPSLDRLKANYDTETFDKKYNSNSTLMNIGFYDSGYTGTIGELLSRNDYLPIYCKYLIWYGSDKMTGLDLNGNTQTWTYIHWLEYWYNNLIDDSMGYSDNTEDIQNNFYRTYAVPDGTLQTPSEYNGYYPDEEHLMNGKIVHFDDISNVNYNDPNYQKVGYFKKGLFKGHSSCCNYEIEDICIKIAIAFCNHYFGCKNLTNFNRHGVKYVDLHYVKNKSELYDDIQYKSVAGEFGKVYDTKLGIFETQQDILLRNGITCSMHFTPIQPVREVQTGLYYGQSKNRFPYFWSATNYGGRFQYLDLIGTAQNWKSEEFTMNDIYKYFGNSKDWIKYAYENAGKLITGSDGSNVYVHQYFKNAIDIIRESYGTNLIPCLSLDTINNSASDCTAIELLCQYCIKNGNEIVTPEYARKIATSLDVPFKHNYFPNPAFNQTLICNFGGNSTSPYAYIPDGFQIYAPSGLDAEFSVSDSNELTIKNNGGRITLTTRIYGLPSGNYDFSVQGKSKGQIQLFVQKNGDYVEYYPVWQTEKQVNADFTENVNSEVYSNINYEFTIPEKSVKPLNYNDITNLYARGYENNVSNVMIVFAVDENSTLVLKQPKLTIK